MPASFRTGTRLLERTQKARGSLRNGMYGSISLRVLWSQFLGTWALFDDHWVVLEEHGMWAQAHIQRACKVQQPRLPTTRSLHHVMASAARLHSWLAASRPLGPSIDFGILHCRHQALRVAHAPVMSCIMDQGFDEQHHHHHHQPSPAPARE